MSKIKKELLSIEVFKNIEEYSLRLLESMVTIKDFKKGEQLFRDKEELDYIYSIINGFASLYKISSSGEKKVIFILGNGKMINEVMIQDLPSSINCEIFEDSRIAYIKKSDIISVMEKDFKLTKAIMDSMAIKVRRLYRQLKNTPSSLTVDKRLAAKLWKLSGDFGVKVSKGIEIDMDMSITYLADMLGSKRETVSRQVKKLSQEKLIIVKNNRFIVLDRKKLNEYFKMS